MKCGFYDREARGTCAACSRGLCHPGANFYDEMTPAKPAASTVYASHDDVYGTLECSERRLEWTAFRPGR